MPKTLRGMIAFIEDCDGWLVASVLILCLLGTVMVFGAASYRSEALDQAWGHYYYLVKHLARLALGLVALVALVHLDHRFFRRKYLNWFLLGAGMALTLVPVVIIGLTRGDCSRWFSLFGWFPVQPVELVKIALVLFLAERLADTRQTIPTSWQSLGWVLLPPGFLVFILILQPNFGNALVICLLTLVVLFAAGLPLRKMGLLVAPMVGAGLVGVMTVSKIATRVNDWLAGLRGEGASYQLEQSLIGHGAGGLCGLGFGASHQRFWFLPESHTDFIFSVLGEELGLLGTVSTVVLFTIFAVRGLRVARGAADEFSRLVAIGLTSLIFLYAISNMAMTTGLLPVMGLPLPFVSYGGSALVSNLAAVGILISIDRQGRAYRKWRSRWASH
jgi:cell division protein FtsW